MSQWRNHANFVNAVVIEGFTAVVVYSLNHLVRCLEASNTERGTNEFIRLDYMNLRSQINNVAVILESPSATLASM